MNDVSNRKLKMALVGGGGGAFIGKVHFRAATYDNRAELVAGVLSSDPERSKSYAADFGIAPDRAYGTVAELLQTEAALPADKRIDFVSIATPNHTHHQIAAAVLAAGFHVVCDKPMTTTLATAQELVEQVEASGLVFALTHNYTGYPLMRQARRMVADGELGEIQAVRVHYLQGWLHGFDARATVTRGAWKSDPAKAGKTGTLGDVGTHAYNLARFVCGLRPLELCCQTRSFTAGWPLDDYALVMLRLENDALCNIAVSQATHGRLNDLTLEVDGRLGAIVWRQESPNQLHFSRFGKPTETLERQPGVDYLHDDVGALSRIPGGHPEGFLDAFANVYRDAMADIKRHQAGQSIRADQTVYPNVHDGLEGVQFLEQCVASHEAGGTWLPINGL